LRAAKRRGNAVGRFRKARRDCFLASVLVLTAEIPAINQKPPNKILARNRFKEFSSANRLSGRVGIAIFRTRLRSPDSGPCYSQDEPLENDDA
jgi:hypothetical protein